MARYVDAAPARARAYNGTAYPRRRGHAEGGARGGLTDPVPHAQEYNGPWCAVSAREPSSSSSLPTRGGPLPSPCRARYRHGRTTPRHATQNKPRAGVRRGRPIGS